MSICPNNCSNVLNGDSFKHTISISDIVNGKREILSLDNISIIATYKTKGSDVKTFVATKTGSVFVNCIYSSIDKKLKVIFQDYDLDNGELYGTIVIKVQDSDYPSGEAVYTRYVVLGINLANELDMINVQV